VPVSGKITSVPDYSGCQQEMAFAHLPNRAHPLGPGHPGMVQYSTRSQSKSFMGSTFRVAVSSFCKAQQGQMRWIG
jgi:hypothetical protein